MTSLLKVSLLSGCLLLGVLGHPFGNNGNHPHDCSGKAPGSLCREGKGVCVYRYDPYGDERCKECVGYCGESLPDEPENSEIILPDGFNTNDAKNWTYLMEGVSLEFTCASGYNSTCSYKEVVCLSSGEWSDPGFECRIDCGEPEVEAPMTVVSRSGTLFGDLAVISCPDGTTRDFLTCTHNEDDNTGEWVGAGSCVVQLDCGEPEVEAPMTVVSRSGTLFGDLAVISCPDGTTRDFLTCTHNEDDNTGEWVGAGSCVVQLDCGEPEVEAPMTVVSRSGTLFGDLAVISCPDGTTRDFLTCTHNEDDNTGEWLGAWSCVVDDVEASEYLGCFEDRAVPDRTLPDGRTDNTSMTTEMCKAHCRAYYPAGTTFYFGTEAYSVCFCSTKYPIHPKKPESDCNMPCDGDSSQICGGPWRISVYKVTSQ